MGDSSAAPLIVREFRAFISHSSEPPLDSKLRDAFLAAHALKPPCSKTPTLIEEVKQRSLLQGLDAPLPEPDAGRENVVDLNAKRQDPDPERRRMTDQAIWNVRDVILGWMGRAGTDGDINPEQFITEIGALLGVQARLSGDLPLVLRLLAAVNVNGHPESGRLP